MAKVIRLHGDPHEMTLGLLPWYANGTLDPEEVSAVEAHLSECAQCRAELDSERALARQVASLPDHGWATLRSRIEAGAPQRKPSASAFLRRPVAIGWALAAQAACLVLVVGGIAWFSASAPSAPQPRPLYRALGAPAGASVGDIVVAFRPTATEAELRDVLRRSGARVVDGPTAADAYVLSVPPGQRAAALARLRAAPQVALAQPINGDARP